MAFLPQFVNPAGQVAAQFLVLGFVSVSMNTLADILVATAAARIRTGAEARPKLNRRLREGSGAAVVALWVGLALVKAPAD